MKKKIEFKNRIIIMPLIFVFITALVLTLMMSKKVGLANAENSFQITDQENQELISNLSSDKMDEYLRKFLRVSDEKPDGDLGARDIFSASERMAAEHLYQLVLENDSLNAYSDKETIIDGKSETEKILVKERVGDRYEYNFSEFVTKVSSSAYSDVQEKTTQNIIVTKKSKNPHTPNSKVVFGANYDNPYSTDETDTKSRGAMNNGTGVATLLALVNALKDIELDVDIDFVFFGGDTLEYIGSKNYLNNNTSKIIMMFNFYRLGGDYTYMYSHEEQAEHFDYMYSLASQLSSNVNKVPNTLPIISTEVISGIPYSTYAMNSSHSVFISKKINTVHFYSANHKSFNVADIESSSNKAISGTASDTYTTLVDSFPLYKTQMSSVATLTSQAIINNNFTQTMINISNNGDYINWRLIQFIIYTLICTVAIILIVLVVQKSGKLNAKYPLTVKSDYKKEPISVFGSKYEDGTNSNNSSRDAGSIFGDEYDNYNDKN